MSESQQQAYIDNVFDIVVKTREKICDEYCKYTNSKEYRGISKDDLAVICNEECPLSKI